MSFWTIFFSLLVLLIIYYAVMIFMDLNSSQQADDKNKPSEEKDIDISDVANTFKPINADGGVNDDSEPEETAVAAAQRSGAVPIDALCAHIARMANGEDVSELSNIVMTCHMAQAS